MARRSTCAGLRDMAFPPLRPLPFGEYGLPTNNFDAVTHCSLWHTIYCPVMYLHIKRHKVSIYLHEPNACAAVLRYYWLAMRLSLSASRHNGGNSANALTRNICIAGVRGHQVSEGDSNWLHCRQRWQTVSCARTTAPTHF